LNLKPLTLNLHRELRLALLAAMETCWVFAVVVFLAAQIDQPRPLTPLPFFIAYWIALVIGRALPQSRKQWIALQVLALSIAALTVLAVVRVELFPAFYWYDLAWLPRALAAILSITRGFATEHLVVAGVLYVFIRGFGFAQRPLTLWFVGFQFRLGIVVFFILSIIAGFARSLMLSDSFDPSLWIFVYFFVSLLAIALARIEEMGGEIRYGPRWALTIFGGIALVLFIGLGILQFFNPGTARWLLLPLMPIWLLVTAIIMLLAIPAGYLVGWIVDWLRPIFETMGLVMQNLVNLIPSGIQETLTRAPESSVWLDIANIASRLIVPTALMIVAYFLVRALNRRMKRIEDETYVREAIGVAEDASRARRGAMKKPRSPRSFAHHIAAESIRRIYAALVARAADAGLPRRAAETPYEFLPRLTQKFPEQTEEIHSITEAYVAVHYAEENIAPEVVARVRAAWQRVEAAIRVGKKR
jgi:hypothetical protein